MTERMERDLVALQQRLIAQAADERAAFQVRIRSADRVQESLGALQAELRANVDEFNKVMSASLRSMTALGDSGVTGLERQLLFQDSDVSEALNGLRARTATLERQFDQVDDSLSVLAKRLPDLDSGVDRLAERLGAATAGFERVESQVATIQAQAPELALRLEGQRQALAQDLDLQRQTMAELGAEIASLQGALDDSRSQLATSEGSLGQELARARQQGDGALDQVRAAERQPSEVVTQDARSATTPDGMQERIDAVLAQLAETADLAVLRSEDALKRAEVEAARRLEIVTEQAIGDLSEAHGAQLAELSRWASATRAELEQTRVGLIAGWRGMDEAVAERQLKVLAELDQYAATLEVRVQEFLKALDVIVARSSG
jgi:predicted  nucleic acid-binding Zn-ribbon protein